MDKRKLENPLSRLMGLAGKQKKKYALSIPLLWVSDTGNQRSIES